MPAEGVCSLKESPVLNRFSKDPNGCLALSATEVARLLGIARSQVFKLVAAGRFPKPIRLGRRNPRWLVSDLDAYLKGGGSHPGLSAGD